MRFFTEADMTRRILAVWFGGLTLFAAPSHGQEPQAPPQAAKPSDRTRLRAEVVRLRAEVEMLGLDLEIERADLLEDLKSRKGLEMLGGMMSLGNAVQSGTNRAAANRRQAPPRAVAEEKAARAEMEWAQKKADEEKAKLLSKRKQTIARLAATLAERRLDLDDAERQYRAPGTMTDPPRWAAAEREPEPVVLTSTAEGRVPVLEPAREDRDRVPILDPTGDPSAPCCVDPPGEDEIWRGLSKPRSAGTKRTNARFTIEKIGERVDPSKVYPLAGACRLVHCHYKCTVTFDEETPGTEDVAPLAPSRRSEVVFIDKDHLRRCPGSDSPPKKSPDAVAPASIPADPGPEGRAIRIEEKLDRILRALDGPKNQARD
jgi:hypothetical protein